MRDGADARVRGRGPARRILRPSQPERAHFDLRAQPLKLLRLRLGPPLAVDHLGERQLNVVLRARALAALLRPRVEELHRVCVALDGGVEQRLQALLAPRQLLLVVILERLPPVHPSASSRATRALHQRLLQLRREAVVVEAAAMRLGLRLTLPPAPVVDVGRPLEVLVPHLLHHARDVLGRRVPEHPHQHVDAAEVALDPVVGHVRADGRRVRARVLAGRKLAILARQQAADGAPRVAHGDERSVRHLLGELHDELRVDGPEALAG
eukprot:755816-Prymnesium_polylepis.1